MSTPKKEKKNTRTTAKAPTADVSKAKPPSTKTRGQQKNVASAKSTGARGVSFEHRVQAVRLLAMCLDMPCPGIPEECSIVKIVFQGRVLGHNTDDLILTISSPARESGTVRMQMKRAITPTAKNKTFEEAIGLAWLDFKGNTLRPGLDATLIVYQSASAKSMEAAVEVASLARTTSAAADWHTKVHAADFSNERNREAYRAIQAAADLFNKSAVPLSELHQFVVHLKFLQHDLDSDSTAEVSMQKLLLAMAMVPNAETGRVWAQLVQVCVELNGAGGDVDLATVDRHIGQPLANSFKAARAMCRQREAGQIEFTLHATSFTAAHGVSRTTSSLAISTAAGTGAKAGVGYEETAPVARATSPNKVVSRQLESIDGLRKEGRFVDALAQLKVLGQDMNDFDVHQRALWYWLRGMARWHIDTDISATADDLIKAADLSDDEDKLAAARVRGLFLKQQLDEAIIAGEAAMERFPESLVVWAATVNARIVRGQRLTVADIPREHVDQSIAWQLLAASQELGGDVVGAFESARTALTKNDATFFTREALLRYALQQVSEDGLTLAYRIVPVDKRVLLEEAIAAFADRSKWLWSVQSPTAQAAVLTHLGYAYLLTHRADQALGLIEEAQGRSAPRDSSLFRVEIEALLDLDRASEVLTKFESSLPELPNEALVSYAQAAFVADDLPRADAADAEALRRSEGPDAARLQSTMRLIRWNLLLVQGRVTDLRAELVVAGVTPESSSIPELVFSAWSNLQPDGDKAIADLLIDRIAGLCTSDTPPSEAHLGAKLLFHARRFEAAAEIFARILVPASFSELHVEVLYCYLRTGQRAKGRKLLESMSPDWKGSKDARHMAIDLAQHAGDWPMVAELADLEVAAAPAHAAGWILRILAASNMELPGLAAVIGAAPVELSGSMQEISRLAAAEMRHGFAEKGLRRIYHLRRERMGDVDGAALHLMAVMLMETTLPQLEAIPEVAGPGTTVVLADEDGKHRQLSIDPEGMNGLAPFDDFIAPNDEIARRLVGLRVGETIDVPRTFEEPRTYRIVQLKSAHRRLIEASHKAITTSITPPKAIAAMSLQIEEDGTPDLNQIRRQLEKRAEFATETMDLYESRPVTLGVTARRLGHDVIDLVRNWPSTGTKLGVGSGRSQGHKDLQLLLRSGTAWVVDLTMLTELAMLGHLDVLGSLPEVFVASVTRDAVGAKLESTSAFRHTGSMFTHEGQIAFRESTEDNWRRERNVIQAIGTTIHDHCSVLPAWGPVDIHPALVRTKDVLTPPEYASLLLCQERGASLLTLDERLGRIAGLFGIKSAKPQELLLYSASVRKIGALDYSLAMVKMMLARRSFISLTVNDLIAMMDQGDRWVSIGIGALREYLADPHLNFETASNVVVRFLCGLYARGNCEFGVSLELIEFLIEPLLRHKGCPKDWVTGCTMMLFTEFTAADPGFDDHRVVAEFVRRAAERAKHPMKPVVVKARVLHFMHMPRLVTGDLNADPASQERISEENRVTESYAGPATKSAEGREQLPPVI